MQKHSKVVWIVRVLQAIISSWNRLSCNDYRKVSNKRSVPRVIVTGSGSLEDKSCCVPDVASLKLYRLLL